MELKTRRMVHGAVTNSPTDEWTAQQLHEATPWGKDPKYLLHDRDSKYGSHFSAVTASSHIKELRTLYPAPRANGICERFMGSMRRECMDKLLSFIVSIYSGWSRNMQLTTIRNDPIRELANASPTSTISLKKTQKGEFLPRLSSGVYTTVIPA
jgi:hypothetical protein